jgi:argininosuccinate lyase
MKFSKGRFRSRLDPKALAFSSSLDVDKWLFREDIQGSLAHVTMLARQNIISSRDAGKIKKALIEIRKEISRSKIPVTVSSSNNGRFVAEDIHMFIEHRLMQKIGPLGGKLHTARSRNDQIALDERLYLRGAIGDVQSNIRKFQKELVHKANKYQNVIISGYTHLQQAQPILFAHHLLAYVSMLERDYERFRDCLNRVNRNPLGAGALAGTAFPINRKTTSVLMRFNNIVENSIDAVSDRDVLIEAIASAAITMMHLSRFAEEMVLWSSTEWGFADIGEAYTTGSSIMPQKKNPDMAELIRGKTGRVYGDLMSLLTVMKALPLAYNRDLQEDKEPLFDALNTVNACLEIFTGMIKSTKFNTKQFERFHSDLLLATELADYLARKGVPFRNAHKIVGALVRECVQNNNSLRSLPLEKYKQYSKLFEQDVYKSIDIRESIKQKRSSGSTSFNEVRKAISGWKKKLRYSKTRK